MRDDDVVSSLAEYLSVLVRKYYSIQKKHSLQFEEDLGEVRVYWSMFVNESAHWLTTYLEYIITRKCVRVCARYSCIIVLEGFNCRKTKDQLSIDDPLSENAIA